MSFGSSLRFEVKDGGKGIFWQKDKPKQNSRKFGYKSKEMRHALRQPEPEPVEEPSQNPKQEKDFIKRNRNQFKPRKPEEDKENHHGYRTISGRPSSHIKPGTVTLTQEQLNTLLATVGKMKGGDGGNLRISIDAENNYLQVESPKDANDSANQSSRSDAGYEGSVDLEWASSNEKETKTVSGSSSEEKTVSGKGVRFDSARNVEHERTPDPAPSVPPPLVPWKHMTVAERKRLQWASEKAAEEELQKQVRSYSDPWGRPGAGAPPKKPDSTEDAQFKTKEEASLRAAVDNIQKKYEEFLKPSSKEEESRTDLRDKKSTISSQYQSKKDTRETNDSDGRRKKSDYSGIPGLGDDTKREKPKRDMNLDKSGNTRPKKPDRDPRHQSEKERLDTGARKGRKEEAEREERKKTGRQRRVEEDRPRRDEEERAGDWMHREKESNRMVATALRSEAHLPPAAMQTSLFIGQPEADNSRFMSKKELERKQWLDELNHQREEQRMQKQREKEKARQGGPDDTWANRFVEERGYKPSASHLHQQLHSAPYATSPEDHDRPGVPTKLTGERELQAMPPAAMRSALHIGDAAPSMDRIEQKQAEEKRLWLQELDRQREELREARMRLKEKQRAPDDETWAERFTQDPHYTAASTSNAVQNPDPYKYPSVTTTAYQEFSSGRTSSAPQAATSAVDEESKTYIRGQNVPLDPVTRQQMEAQRGRQLQHQAAIRAQIDEKERHKREERERRWREEAEEEQRLQAERDSLQRQLEMEGSKKRQTEEARQRQVEQVKTMMDAEQEKAQEERIKKRLVALQQAGHDVSQLKAHYDDLELFPFYGKLASRRAFFLLNRKAITPRNHHSGVINPAAIPGLQTSLQKQESLPQTMPAHSLTNRSTEPAHHSQEVSMHMSHHEPYVENRVLTPSRYRHPSLPHSDPTSPHREFATQTDSELERYTKMKKEMSEVEIEFRVEPNTRKESRKDHSKQRSNSRPKSAEKKKSLSKQNRPSKKQPLKGQPAKWNYQNPEHKTPVKQSEKDPFYEEKRQRAEERRAHRERHLQYLQELNKQVIPTGNHPPASRVQNHADDDDRVQRTEVTSRREGDGRKTRVINGNLSHRSQSPPLNTTRGRYRPANRSLSPPVPSVRHRTGQNPAHDLETEFDADAHNYYRGRKGEPPNAPPAKAEQSRIAQKLTASTDFIPFTRTTDILDPSRADEPVQLSRENTRIRQARQHYHENQRPADYGARLDVYSDKQRQPVSGHKDPILNPSLVKDHPTARQDQILQQLSSLKQSLIQRQRELETCMSPSDFEKQP